MPFEIRENSDGEFCVFTQGEGGKNHGCHATEEEAKAQLRALYANVPEAQKADYMITFGAAVKAMPNGEVGGYLVQFGGEATKDAEGEWFTEETDFDTEFPARASIYYNHGLDPVVGRRRLGHGSMKKDDVGVWVQAQLDLADRHQAAMYRMAQAGKLGWSSGSLSHITDPPREQPGGAIKSWPLGHDASLTPIPADRRNLAVALKSWEPPPLEELISDSALSSGSLAEDTDRALDAATAFQARLDCVLPGYQAVAEKSAQRLSRARWARLNELEAASVKALEGLRALIAETAPRDAEAVAPPPATGEGAANSTTLEKAAEAGLAGSVSLPLPDVGDLYAALIQQEDRGLSLTGRR